MDNRKIWEIALCSQRKEKDVVGVWAYRNGLLVGLAGASKRHQVRLSPGLGTGDAKDRAFVDQMNHKV